jgi:hypothetical protein
LQFRRWWSPAGMWAPWTCFGLTPVCWVPSSWPVRWWRPGFKDQIVDNADGVILDHTVEMGNPPDARSWPRAIERITTRTGHTPRAVTADRGYGQASVEHDLHQPGVRSVAIPGASKPSAARREFEHRRAVRDKVKWRTGTEGRINHSNEATAGAAPNSPASTEPEPGAHTASSPTTWSKSAPSQLLVRWHFLGCRRRVAIRPGYNSHDRHRAVRWPSLCRLLSTNSPLFATANCSCRSVTDARCGPARAIQCQQQSQPVRRL